MVAQPESPRYWAVIPAAGLGLRYGSQLPKQYLPLCGRPLLEHTLACFLERADMAAVVLVLAAGDTHWHQLRGSDSPRLLRAPGGNTRSESVYHGLLALTQADDEDWVLVHDAARPCLCQEDIDRLLRTLSDDACGGLLAVPVQDTLKREGEGGGKNTLKRQDSRQSVRATVNREGLWQALTPQMFRLGALREALAAAHDAGEPVTDEAMAMERQGNTPRLVPGRVDNIKVTREQDLQLAEHILRARPPNPNDGGNGQGSARPPNSNDGGNGQGSARPPNSNDGGIGNASRPRHSRATSPDLGAARAPAIRVGHGYDAHRLAPGRPLVLGGVCIPHERGLLGHSDADVLIHAVCDALLGAMALGDIGQHFPDHEEQYRGMDSRILLRKVRALLVERDLAVSNLDATVLAEAPKLAPWLAAMRANLAADLHTAEACINIKASTTEGMGALGRGEGMAAHAVAVLALR